jgi:hypothetical protein
LAWRGCRPGVSLFAKEGVCQSPYYQGKTITFVQGRDPGGVGDLRNKVIFEFLQRYIPGHPTIISEYMPGGGGERLHTTSITTQRAMGSRSAPARRAFSRARRAPSRRPIGGPRAVHSQQALRLVLGLKEPKFVVGYAGPELDVALERGEIDARAAAVEKETMSEEYKKIVDFHAVLEIPLGSRPVPYVPSQGSVPVVPIVRGVKTKSSNPGKSMVVGSGRRRQFEFC